MYINLKFILFNKICMVATCITNVSKFNNNAKPCLKKQYYTAIISILLTKSLNLEIPLFINYYGFDKCTLLYREHEKIIIHPYYKYKSKNLVHIYEYYNAKPLSKVLKDLNTGNQLNYFNTLISQLFLGLAVAQEKYKLQHNQFVIKNVLIVKLDKEYDLQYVVEGKKIIIKSAYIVKLINYSNIDMQVKNTQYKHKPDSVFDIHHDVISMLKNLTIKLLKNKIKFEISKQMVRLARYYDADVDTLNQVKILTNKSTNNNSFISHFLKIIGNTIVPDDNIPYYQQYLNSIKTDYNSNIMHLETLNKQGDNFLYLRANRAFLLLDNLKYHNTNIKQILSIN